MRPFARLAQFKLRAPRDDFAAMEQKTIKQLPKVEQTRLVIDQRHHVHTEGILQLRHLVQIVQDDFGDFAALEFNDDAHAGFVRLVAQIGNALDPLLVDQLADFFKQDALVNLVRNLVNDDGLTIGAALDVFKMRPGAHDDASASGAVAFTHARNAVDDAGCRKVRRRHDLNQFIDADCRIVQDGQASIDDFVKVVRRNIGRHTDGDPR